MTTRTETDSLGSIEIDADALWGPQTERARLLFAIGSERFPRRLLRALGLQKQAAAEANAGLGQLPEPLAAAIAQAAAEVADGRHDAQFPLPIWQTGSGTQTNMNANEVIARLASRSLGAKVHPNDHVNRGQSSNDSFPTVMHVAAAEAVTADLLPSLALLQAALERRAEDWSGIIKVARTHMMDAVPVTLGSALATWADQIRLGQDRVRDVLPRLLRLPQGGTAAGSGLNTHAEFAARFAERISALTGLAFTANPNPSEGMAAHDVLVELHGMLNVLAVSMNKMANDVRLLGSGPRAGIAEFVIPADGLSSSIMPGKTNPTQSEALSMVCAQVMGNQTTVTIAGAQGHLELNVFKPVIIQSVLQSVRLLGDAARSFAAHMIDKLEPNRTRIAENLAKSLMLVTALNPRIGYDKAVAIGKLALAEDITLKEAAIRLGHVTAEQFDDWVKPADMLRPGATLEG